jgi:uncharacterized membrane protein YfcA
MKAGKWKVILSAALLTLIPSMVWAFASCPTAESMDSTAWWVWPLLLLIATFLMGVIAVPGGIGGGVLYVPIIGCFFPFHIDFVRSAGLLVALSGSLAAGPSLLQANLASLRLAMPVALVTSACAIIGAMFGLALPASTIKLLLGITILGIVGIMLTAKKSTFPDVPQPDALSTALGICGICQLPDKSVVDWRIHRTIPSLLTFILVGIMAGMFGLGAGWANVPILNLMMGAPLKVSVASSKFLLSITDTSAAWVYLNNGAVIPMLVAPSLIGIMLGSFVGVRILKVAKPSFIRRTVIAVLAFAGGKALFDGLMAVSLF